MAASESTAIFPGTSSLDPSRTSMPPPQLHSPIPLLVPSIRPPPPSSLPQPHFGGGSRVLRSGVAYPVNTSAVPPPHRATSSNSINVTSPTLGRAITKRSSNHPFDTLTRSGSLLSNVFDDNAQGPWWTTSNVPSSPSQYNRAFPLLPTPTRRFSENDWTVTVMRDHTADMIMQPSNSDLDYRNRRSNRRNSKK